MRGQSRHLDVNIPEGLGRSYPNKNSALYMQLHLLLLRFEGSIEIGCCN